MVPRYVGMNRGKAPRVQKVGEQNTALSGTVEVNA